MKECDRELTETHKSQRKCTLPISHKTTVFNGGDLEHTHSVKGRAERWAETTGDNLSLHEEHSVYWNYNVLVALRS